MVIADSSFPSTPTKQGSDGLPIEMSEDLIVHVVHIFYGRVRQDDLLGPIFESHVGHRWDEHLATLVDFWTSVALKSGRYRGNPQAVHRPMPLGEEHFVRWLALFETTVRELCAGGAAALFLDRAHRIAESLQIGMNIGPKSLRLPT